MTAAANPSERGFTLVEMLVALVIFALLSAAGVVILRSSVATQAAVDTRLIQISGLGRLHSVLGSDLAQLADRPTRGPSGERPAFSGNDRGMDFVRAGWTNLDDDARSDLQRVEWRFSGQGLTRSGFRNLDGDGGGTAAAPLARALASARIRYRTVEGGW
ncbi:MAG: type II secretion system minor pseudopilin GspJ, partial [Sphingomonas sp.]|nr:type II secretion system minor pseudopilin GspJ [Sphingomonas sp.]